MNVQTINIVVGPSRSGKSHLGKIFLAREDSKWIVVGRDKIREQLYSYEEKDVEWYWQHPNLNEHERVVERVMLNNIRFLLREGYNIYLDGTHLDKDRISLIKREFAECRITFTVMRDANLSESLERDEKSTRKVGKHIISQQFQKFKELIKVYDFSPIEPRIKPIISNPDLPNVYIFDIDKTLSDASHRYIFTDVHDEIYEDKVIEPVKRILDLIPPEQVIFVSGRTEKYRQITEKWLKDKVFPHSISLYMRNDGDFRKDTIIKEEIFHEISRNYNIVCAFDDRNCVTSYLRKMGIFVFNVNQTEEEY